MSKKYLVSVHFDGIIEYEVDVNNDMEAREEAEAMFNEEDARVVQSGIYTQEITDCSEM